MAGDSRRRGLVISLVTRKTVKREVKILKVEKGSSSAIGVSKTENSALVYNYVSNCRDELRLYIVTGEL